MGAARSEGLGGRVQAWPPLRAWVLAGRPGSPGSGVRALGTSPGLVIRTPFPAAHESGVRACGFPGKHTLAPPNTAPGEGRVFVACSQGPRGSSRPAGSSLYHNSPALSFHHIPGAQSPRPGAQPASALPSSTPELSEPRSLCRWCSLSLTCPSTLCRPGKFLLAFITL